jgi:hypothetical protein
MALPDTGTSRTIILRRLLHKAKIKYNTCGREPIVTANSSPLGCVGNVLFPAKVHLTKVAPRVMHRRVKMSKPCTEPNAAIKRVNMTNMQICAEPNAAIKRVNMTNMPICAEPNGAIKRVNMTNMPICAELNAIKRVNKTSKSINPVLQQHTVKRKTVTASTAGQPLGPCLKQNLTNDTLDSLMKEFKDIFEADKITPLTGDPMQIHLKWDDPSYCNKVRDRYEDKVAHTFAHASRSSRCGRQLCKRHERSTM